jgi:putative AlgH/UPF0301 family transcriptional regulator
VQAWKIHAVLPHKASTRKNGTVPCPLSVYMGGPVSVFRVMVYDNVNVSKSKSSILEEEEHETSDEDYSSEQADDYIDDDNNRSRDV